MVALYEAAVADATVAARATVRTAAIASTRALERSVIRFNLPVIAGRDRSGLLDNARFQLHRTESVDFAVDVMVADAVDEANVADLRSALDRARTFDLELLDHGDRVAVCEHIAGGIFDHRFRGGAICRGGG